MAKFTDYLPDKVHALCEFIALNALEIGEVCFLKLEFQLLIFILQVRFYLGLRSVCLHSVAIFGSVG